jgi:2-methylcitrate dehydratase PrpD
VRVEADAECTAQFPRQFPAVLTARLADGTEIQERVSHNRGGPANPLSPEELTRKFRLNARRSVDDAVAEELARRVWRLSTDGRPELVADLLGPA